MLPEFVTSNESALAGVSHTCGTYRGSIAAQCAVPAETHEWTHASVVSTVPDDPQMLRDPFAQDLVLGSQSLHRRFCESQPIEHDINS